MAITTTTTTTTYEEDNDIVSNYREEEEDPDGEHDEYDDDNDDEYDDDNESAGYDDYDQDDYDDDEDRGNYDQDDDYDDGDDRSRTESNSYNDKNTAYVDDEAEEEDDYDNYRDADQYMDDGRHEDDNEYGAEEESYGSGEYEGDDYDDQRDGSRRRQEDDGVEYDDDDDYDEQQEDVTTSSRREDYSDQDYEEQSNSRSSNGDRHYEDDVSRSSSAQQQQQQQHQHQAATPQSPIQAHAKQLRDEMRAAMAKAPQIRPMQTKDDDDDQYDRNGDRGRTISQPKQQQQQQWHKPADEDPHELQREVREILQAANERLSPRKKEEQPTRSQKQRDRDQQTNGVNGVRNHRSTPQNSSPTVLSPRNDGANGPVGDPLGRHGGSHQQQNNPMQSPSISSPSSPPSPSSTKKNNDNGGGGGGGGLPKGSMGSHSRRSRGSRGRGGGTSSHHRRGTGSGGGSGTRISWKSDPDASFSDWTIRVYHEEGGGGMEKYYIHRNICGYGHRKSQYLLRAFRGEENEMSASGIKSDSTNSTTLLDMPSTRARVFPMVMDFMYYTKESKSTLTAARACEVFLLAELLEIPSLQKAISDFYMKNLSIKNMAEFLTAATDAKAEVLLIVCKSKIGKMITEKPQLAGLVPPKYLADILLISRKQLDNARSQNPERYPESLVVSQSRYWSKAACICAVHNESILTRNLFENLTGEDALPYIDASVAPKLLSLDKKFNHSESSEGEYTSLQIRCISSIADDFGTFQRGFDSEEKATESLKQLPSHVLADILVKTMNQK